MLSCSKTSLHWDILSLQARTYGISGTEAGSTVHVYSFTHPAQKEVICFVKPRHTCICTSAWEKWAEINFTQQKETELFLPIHQPAPQQQWKPGIHKPERTRKIISSCLKFVARRHSLLVCFNAEKLPQTSVLIVKSSFDVSSEEAPSYLAWGEGPLPEVAVATPPGLCDTAQPWASGVALFSLQPLWDSQSGLENKDDFLQLVMIPSVLQYDVLAPGKKPQQPLHRDLCSGWVSVTAGLLNATLRPHCYRVMTLNAEYESRISFPFNPPSALLIWLISKLPTDLHANWSLLIDKGNAAFELYLLCALYFLIGTECIFFAWTKIIWN